MRLFNRFQGLWPVQTLNPMMLFSSYFVELNSTVHTEWVIYTDHSLEEALTAELSCMYQSNRTRDQTLDLMIGFINFNLMLNHYCM